MRANTSLISHILGSHPQISGYYEMHLSYRRVDDLLLQKQRLLDESLLSDDTGDKQQATYCFDKLLHNDYQLLLENFSHNTMTTLVSIRSPKQSIKSIVHLFQQKHASRSYAKIANAADYYCQRIQSLAQFCALNPQRYYYFDAELIRTQSQYLLDKLQDWLSLSTPLSEHYQIFSHTGKMGAGDSSANINAGKIINCQPQYEDIVIPQKLLTQVEAMTCKHKKVIQQYAIDSINT